MKTVKENVNGWDIVEQSQWISDEGHVASPYGCMPSGYGTNWRIQKTGKYLKQNTLNGCVFGKPMGGAWGTVEECEEECNKFKPSRLSPGD